MDFIYDLWDDLLHGDISERVMVGLLLILLVMALFLILIGMFFAADRIGTSDRTVNAKILSREYHPEWTQTYMMMAGKVIIPQRRHHPESWSVSVMTEDNDVLDCSCSKSFFDRYEERSDIVVIVSSRRLSGDTYCQVVQHP